MKTAWRGLLCLLFLSAATGQNRPLVTESATLIPEGRIRAELGFEFLQDTVFRLSGLEGDLSRLGVLGLRTGVAEKVEIQMFWTAAQFLNVDRRFPAPNSDILDFEGNSTSDVGNLFMATKLRLATESGRRPALAFRFGVELPNTSNVKGLGNDETNFHSSLIAEKTLGRLVLLGNIGLSILGDPVEAGFQDDLLTYGFAAVYSLGPGLAVLADWYGRAGPGGIGTEEQSLLRVGTQIETSGIIWDAALLFGFRDTDPSTGVIVGISRDFDLPFR